jgi:hypothetical protein
MICLYYQAVNLSGDARELFPAKRKIRIGIVKTANPKLKNFMQRITTI